MSQPAGEFAIGLLPPPDISALVDEHRRRYDPLFGRTVPHITVKQPFQLVGELQRLQAALTRVCRDTSPFELVVDDVGCFRHHHVNVVYFAAVLAPPLRHFQRAVVLATAPFARHDYPEYSLRSEVDCYVPHITIGQELSEQQLDELLSRLATDRPRFRFTVESAVLARHHGEGHWRVVSQHRFGGAGEGAAFLYTREGLC